MQVQKQIDHLLALRASEWLEILQRGGERAQFVAWLSESRLHVQEFLEAVAVDSELERLDPDRIEDVEALLARIAPEVTSLRLGTRAHENTMAGGRSRRRLGWVAALAAGTAVVTVGLAVWGWQLDRPEKFSTTTGEQRAVELADASVVHLNAESAIEVEFDALERNIRLVRGEALFKVGRDARRPFRVHARGTMVQALGTQFNVYARPNGTRVSVLEGKVSVTSDRTGQAQTLSAGDTAQIVADGTIAREAELDVGDSVAWRQRRLVFDNAKLEDIVLEFNRYSRSRQLRLDGVEPGSHHYDGTFDADDPASLATLLARESDLIVETRGSQIVISPRAVNPLP